MLSTHTADSTEGRELCGKALADLLLDGETWLTQRILHHAKRHGYTEYTSTLIEAWRLSITGLTASIIEGIEHYSCVPELEPDQVPGTNPIARFGVLEARRHRSRGVSLSMFLGLYKYYKQAYIDLLDSAALTDQQRGLWTQFVRRVFDRIEIAFCSEWASHPLDRLLDDLQSTNRALANEKNAYLTVFESLLTPVILLDPEGRVRTLNHEASKLVRASVAPGAAYYLSDGGTSRQSTWHPRGERVETLFPWLPPSEELLDDSAPVGLFEAKASIAGTERVFEGRISRLLDVSEKLVGTVIVLNDVSEHKALAARLDRLAKTDGLTGTNNRRHFLELAETEVLRARRHGRQLSTLVIDVDHFKNVNDGFGHAAGDQLLLTLTEAMQGTLRATDTLGRLGGEEFAILLPETPKGAAVTAGERVRTAIRDTCVRTVAGPVAVTVSVGTATLRDQDCGFEELLRRADQALYRAKALGRDCVVAACEVVEPRHGEVPGVSSGIAPRPPNADGALAEAGSVGGRR